MCRGVLFPGVPDFEYPSLGQEAIMQELEKKYPDFEKRTGWRLDSEYKEQMPEDLAKDVRHRVFLCMICMICSACMIYIGCMLCVCLHALYCWHYLSGLHYLDDLHSLRDLYGFHELPGLHYLSGLQ